MKCPCCGATLALVVREEAALAVPVSVGGPPRRVYDRRDVMKAVKRIKSARKQLFYQGGIIIGAMTLGGRLHVRCGSRDWAMWLRVDRWEDVVDKRNRLFLEIPTRDLPANPIEPLALE